MYYKSKISNSKFWSIGPFSYALHNYYGENHAQYKCGSCKWLQEQTALVTTVPEQ